MAQENLESQMEMNPYASPVIRNEANKRTWKERFKDFFPQTSKEWIAAAAITVVGSYGIYRTFTDR